MKSVLGNAIGGIVGAVEVVSSEVGVSIHRSAASTRASLANTHFEHVSGTPSGVRIEATTDATCIELHLALTRLVYPGQGIPRSYVDIVVDGVLQEPVPVTSESVVRVDLTDGSMTLEKADPAKLQFRLGETPATRRIEIWLPNAAHTVIMDVRASDGAILVPTDAFAPKWVHYGSSISQCAEVARPTQTWPAIVAKAAGYSLVNLGLSGECHLDQGLARSIRDLDADAISLEIGINIVGGDTMRDRTFVSAFHGFLDTIRDARPDTPMLVASPIYCEPVEDAPGPLVYGNGGPVRAVQRLPGSGVGAMSLARVREQLAFHVNARQLRGDTHLYYLDGLRLFSAEDAHDLPDALHPNAAGYKRIAERFFEAAFSAGGPFSDVRRASRRPFPPLATDRTGTFTD